METQDRISALPDEILCHILSFFSTNDSFATSLLCKRWQPLWLFLSIIDLDDQTFIQNGRSYTSFFKFAYGILLRCHMQQPLTIARFHLTPHVCGYSNDFPYHLFKKWVRSLFNAVLSNSTSRFLVPLRSHTLFGVAKHLSFSSCIDYL